MKRIAIFLFLLYTMSCATIAYQPKSQEVWPKPQEIWPLVAKSHIIATGTLNAPVEQIESCLASNQHQYVEITVATDQLLKGITPSQITIRWYTEPRDYAPHPDRVVELNGKKSLLFLLQVDDASDKELYFAGYTQRALSQQTETIIQQVQNEIAAQRDILVRFEEFFPPEKEPYYDKVARLIDATTRKYTQMNAFRRLEALGPKAVPAIIMLMDDRRDLGVSEISLRNHPGHWETLRHYGPEKVVDAMAAILNQITGEHFGFIYNGGTERERKETVNGWRIYLYYWQKGIHNK